MLETSECRNARTQNIVFGFEVIYETNQLHKNGNSHLFINIIYNDERTSFSDDDALKGYAIIQHFPYKSTCY